MPKNGLNDLNMIFNIFCWGSNQFHKCQGKMLNFFIYKNRTELYGQNDPPSIMIVCCVCLLFVFVTLPPHDFSEMVLNFCLYGHFFIFLSAQPYSYIE